MPTSLLLQPSQIVVVDASPDDYYSLAAEADSRNVAWRRFHSADEFFRCGQMQDVLFWLVHADLPDARGVEIARTLANRQTEAPVLVVSDEYRVATELEVLASGIAHYACKPLSPEWLRQWVRWPAPRRETRNTALASGNVNGA